MASRKIAIGIIGSGGIAQVSHIPAFKAFPERCEIVATSDVDLAVAEKAAEIAGGAKSFTDYKEMLASCDLDAVLVATPNRFHYRPTLDALAAGKHVLCEKPLAMTGAEAREMCEAAKAAKKILQVGLQGRFSGPAQFLKAFIDAGEMGPIYYARAQALRRRGVPGWGSFIDKDKQGGGPLIDIGVHILDLTLWMMGNPKPISASGRTWDVLGKNPALYNGFGDYDHSKFTVEDFAAAFIRFENGVAVSLEASFMGNLDGNPFQTQLFGETSGAVLKPYATEDPLKIFTERNKQLFDMTPANLPRVSEPNVRAADAFLTSIEEGKPSQVPGEAGLALNAIFDALYKSAESGKEEPVVM